MEYTALFAHDLTLRMPHVMCNQNIR